LKDLKLSDTIKFYSVILFFSFLFAHKIRFEELKFEFCQIKWGRITNKRTINWQNFVQVGF